MKQLPRPPLWLLHRDKVVESLRGVHETIGDLIKQPLVHTKVPLEGRGAVIRSQETNMGNMLADAVRAYYGTQIAFVNSGAIRCNRIIPETTERTGALSVRDIIGACHSCAILRYRAPYLTRSEHHYRHFTLRQRLRGKAHKRESSSSGPRELCLRCSY